MQAGSGNAVQGQHEFFSKVDEMAEQFCTECGASVTHAKFCPACGHSTAPAVPVQRAASARAARAGVLTADRASEATRVIDLTTPPPPTVPMYEFEDQASLPASDPELSVGGHGTRSRAAVIVAAGVAVLLVAVAGVFIVLTHGSSAPSFTAQATRSLAPVAAANAALSTALTNLAPSSSPTAVKTALQGAVDATQAAQSTLAVLAPGTSDKALAASATSALGGELSWLKTASALLTDGAGSDLSQITALEMNARDKWTALAATIPTVGSFPGSDQLAAFVHGRAAAAAAKVAAATSKAALTQFSDQIQSLLTQSASGRSQINSLFGQMQTVAAGGYASITLSQAEATISTVIANRTSLAASARSLSAPTPSAKAAQSALVAALDASLTDDQQIDTCLTQANNGSVAYVFQSCLDASAAASQAATAAKGQFLTSYNSLRRELGLAEVQQTF